MAKSRNLSIYELFEVLQREYVICVLRSKIYPYQKHKKYWAFVAEKKKDKILDIANRNMLPNIFSSPDVKKSIEMIIYGNSGYPNFIYKDEEQRSMQEKWDYVNYFSKLSEVTFVHEGNTCVGSIAQFDFTKKNIDILYKGEIISLTPEDVTRIL